MRAGHLESFQYSEQGSKVLNAGYELCWTFQEFQELRKYVDVKKEKFCSWRGKGGFK
jgi:hypothetical protein